MNEFDRKKCKKLAITFYRVYTDYGEVPAGVWANEQIPERLIDEMAPFIREVFEKNGWRFEDEEGLPIPPDTPGVA